MKKVGHEKSATQKYSMKIVQHGEKKGDNSDTWNKCNMKKVQHENSAKRKNCNMEIAKHKENPHEKTQHEKSEKTEAQGKREKRKK